MTILSVFDSWVTSENTVQSLDECIDGATAIVIVTEHSDVIDKLTHYDLSKSSVDVIVDGRNCLSGSAIVDQGILYSGIGRRVS